MKWEKLNRDWFFKKGQVRVFPGEDEALYGEKVNLPHDYMIASDVSPDAPAGPAMGYYTEGAASYTKKMQIPAQWEGQKVYLHFDGVMMNASVNVNGSLVKVHHYGYTPFTADITDYLYYGEENRISVLVNPSMQPNSRWYTGAGIYRDVTLAHVSPIHIDVDGVFAWTKRILSADVSGVRAAEAQVMVEVTVRNTLGKDHQVNVGVTLSPAAAEDREGAADTASSSSREIYRETALFVKAGQTATARIPFTVKDPLLWTAEHTNLCHVKAVVKDMGGFGVCLESSKADETISDTAETDFGIRTVTADAVRGLQVNGKTVKLKGGCIHHDNGLLGAVSLYDSEYRKLKLLKESGFNAVRMAHNPPSSALLDACDRLGLYVIDEAFDAWGFCKQPGDYSQYFADHWKDDMRAFILRDRNHPSVLFWSTGNEVEERGGMGDGYALAMELAAYVRSLDSTRLVTNGLCSMWSGLDDRSTAEYFRKMMEEARGNVQNLDLSKGGRDWEDRTEAFANCLDVVGYNYLDAHYEYAGERYPERVILGTESYPNQIDKVWDLTEKLPYVIGDCTWTAFDYIGEAGIGKSAFFPPESDEAKQGSFMLSSHSSDYPWRLANDADFSINGDLLPQGVYRRIVWGSPETGLYTQHPEHFEETEVVSNWGWNQVNASWNYSGYEGKPVKVFVYSAADEVELFLNGKSVGTKAAGKENRYTAVFQVPYEAGVLSAVSRRKGSPAAGDGSADPAEISRCELKTTGVPASIALDPEQTELTPDGQSLSYVAVKLLDAEGNIVPDARISLTAALESGDAVLAGFGSAAPVTEDNYTSGKCISFHGKAAAVIRAGYEKCSAVLKVTAEGLPEAQCIIRIAGPDASGRVLSR